MCLAQNTIFQLPTRIAMKSIQSEPLKEEQGNPFYLIIIQIQRIKLYTSKTFSRWNMVVDST